VRIAAAKRYLCAAEPAYLDQFSPASDYTLGVQGDPMAPGEIEKFLASPFAADACRVRRWDDSAKDPGAAVPPFTRFAPMLSALTR
jgi:gamma-butyrobetaine dioxygenase